MQRLLSSISAERPNTPVLFLSFLVSRNCLIGYIRFCNSKSLLLLFAAIFFLTTGLKAQNERIIHTPANYATEGLPVIIDVEIESGTEIPAEGRIYYRISGQDAFSYIEMKINRFKLSGEIPGSVLKGDALEYYLEVKFTNNRKINYPEDTPFSAPPLEVVIRPVGAGEGIGEKALVILSPEQGSVVTEDRILIAVSIMQHIRTINQSNLIIAVNGTDLTSQASISEDMATLVVEDVKPGEHHIAFYLKEKGKQEKLTGWSFIMRSPEEAAPPGVFNGSVNAGYNYEDISSEIRNVTWIDGRFNGKYHGLDYATRAYVTNLERGDQQAQNRFLASMRYKILTVKAGDVQPQLSEFSLWGSRTRGAQLALNTRYFNMDAVWGFMRRKVDGAGYDSIVIEINPITGDTLKSAPVEIGGDSTIVTRIERFIIDPATYSRQLMAVRPSFNFSRNIVWGINILKVKDDVNSVEYGLNPVDNLVLGTDLKMYFDHRRIVFTTETSISLYNSDISEGAMSDAKDLENIIVINQNFEPLPTDSSLLDTTTSTIDKAKGLAGEILKSSSAHRTNLVLNYFKNELRIGYKNIGRSYKSLGSPTVLADVSGFTIQDRIRLLNNRLYLTVGYELYNDNVNKRGETTTERQIIRSNISYYSPPRYPNISFGFRQQNRENDGDVTTYTLPDSTTENVDNRIENSTLTYNVGIDQSFKFADLANNVRFSYSNSGTEDQIDPSGYSDAIMNSISLSLSSRKGQRLENNASIRRTSQESQGSRFLVDYNAVSLNSRYMLMPDKLWISGGVSATLADGESMVTPTVPATADSLLGDQVNRSIIKYNRMQLNASIEYNFRSQHQFQLSLNKVIHNDDGSIDYWKWQESDSQWSSKNVKNKDNTDFVNQGDFVTRLTYSYTF